MNIEDQLIRDEGVRFHPYTDSVGKLTIGIGRCLDTKGITGSEARYLFQNDLGEMNADLTHTLPWAGSLDEARYGVLQNMTFNLGMAGLLEFHQMLAAVKKHDYAKAAQEMRDSKWYVQVGDRGERLALQMEDGVWR